MQFLIDFNLKRKNQILNLRRMKETFPFARLNSSGKTFRSNKQAKNIAVDNFPRSSGSVLPARSHRKSFIFPISSCESDEHISFQIFAIYFDSNLLLRSRLNKDFPSPLLYQFLLFSSARFVHPYLFDLQFLIRGTFIILFHSFAFHLPFLSIQRLLCITICIPDAK